MASLTIDCSQGARKGQLVDQLLGMADAEQKAALLDAMANVAIEGLSVEIVNDDHLSILVNGRTEAQAKHEHDHSHEHGDHHHEHRSVADVQTIVEASSLPASVVDDVMGVYDVLAHAEAKVHGTDVEGVHFHEVGNDFAIASIIAFSFLMEEVSLGIVYATPIATGFGYVDCAHGRLPIPAPATANILEDMPHYAGDVEGELCTPTGAAMIRYFVNAFPEPFEEDITE